MGLLINFFVSCITFLLFFVSFGVKSDSIIVINGSQLEKLLCTGKFYEKDTVLLLDSDIIHQITPGKYCTVKISHSLTIASHSNDTLAQINCTLSKRLKHDHERTSGFAFYGTNGSLTMRGLSFISCGTNFTTLDSSIIKSTSRVCFTKDHAAALIFVSIPRLLVEDVSIFDYHGFAIVSVNLQNALFNLLNVSLNEHETAIGSGILVLFYNQNTPSLATDYALTISNSIFLKNYASTKYQKFFERLHCVSEIYKNFSCMPVVSAGGLTIFYTQTDIRATVTLSGNSFKYCSGHLAGAILILHFNSSVKSKTIINGHSNFDSNSIAHHCHGAAIAATLYVGNNELNTTYTPLTVANGTFSNNGLGITWMSGTIDIAVIAADNLESKLHPKIQVVFCGLLFYGNFGYSYGACMFAALYSDLSKPSFVNILLESITAHSNPNVSLLPPAKKYIPVSLFYLSNVNITINGSVTNPGNFSYNFASVFFITHSNANLEGSLYFDSNIGHNGAALSLEGNSYLYLKKALSANFLNNAVQSLGGAICAIGTSSFQCTFQLLSENISGISLNFINNTAAIAGNAIYSTKLYKCSIIYGKISRNLTYYYSAMIKNTSLSDISSVAEKIFFCNSDAYEVYPGGTFHIPIGVYDYSNASTFEIVTVIIVQESNVLKKADWWLSDNQNSFVVKGKENCTVASLTVHASDPSALNKSSLFLFTMSEKSKVITAKVLLRKCPLGYQLDSKTGACLCSNIFNYFKTSEGQGILCNVSSNTFIKPNSLNVWLGTDKTGTKFFVGFCNPSYCNIGSQFNTLYLNTTGSYLSSSKTSKTIQLCFGSRTGILCGDCIPNYSVVFGSSECRMCSSTLWPLTSIIYILMGPLLVFLLYILKLTLTTGTLNGIIFYAQVANLGSMKYLNIYLVVMKNVQMNISLSSLLVQCYHC